jgi:hypothetical protein
MTSLDSLPAALQGWQNFYLLTGTAAATLTGLMFVAVTFGSSLVTRETAQSARAFLDPTYMHFVQVLLMACVVIIPAIGPTFLGGLLVLVALLRLSGLVTVFRRYREAHRRAGDIELSDWTMAIVLPLACHLVLLATGVAFVRREPVALLGLAAVTLGLLLVGIQGAWELLVWMALAVSERRRDAGAATPPSTPASPSPSSPHD